jgi:lambda family phage portal protein
VRYRNALDVLQRHYEGASKSRRTEGWFRTAGDANAASRSALAGLRENARDLVRNNSWAANGVRKATGNVVGTGILPKPKWAKEPGKRLRAEFQETWKAWAESTDCDFEGDCDLYGLQRLAVRTMFESGEVLIRRHIDETSDNKLPLRLQVLEPDHLDAEKTVVGSNGNRIIQGVEYDPKNRRVAYWLFADHPGALLAVPSRSRVSERVDATQIAHMFRKDRPGQVRGISAFAPCVVRLKDTDEYEDAALLRQKIAACFAAFITNTDGSSPSIGDPDDSGDVGIDEIYPGMIKPLKPGEGVTFATPPSTADFESFTRAQLRAVAAGLGITFEQLTGDYSQVNFTSGRMAKVDMTPDVEALQYLTVIPMLCQPIWRWAMMALALRSGEMRTPIAQWTPPAVTMYDRDAEYAGLQRGVRAGLLPLSEAIKLSGYDPDETFEQIEETNKILDAKKIVLDSDPRQTSQGGQSQNDPAADKASKTPPKGKD